MDFYNSGYDEELPPKMNPDLTKIDFFNWDITDSQRRMLEAFGIGLTIIGSVITLALVVDRIKDNTM
jgi:hypothetical protein